MWITHGLWPSFCFSILCCIMLDYLNLDSWCITDVFGTLSCMSCGLLALLSIFYGNAYRCMWAPRRPPSLSPTSRLKLLQHFTVGPTWGPLSVLWPFSLSCPVYFFYKVPGGHDSEAWGGYLGDDGQKGRRRCGLSTPRGQRNSLRLMRQEVL